jgi:hypothetical protein
LPVSRAEVYVPKSLMQSPAQIASLTLERAIPMLWYDGKAAVHALRIRRPARGSLIERLGLRDGDVITSVDGYDADSLATRVSLGEPLLVIEILRGANRIVLGVRAT